MPEFTQIQTNTEAILETGSQKLSYKGQWINEDYWGRFGKYNSYVVVKSDGTFTRIDAHAGEIVPGSTEDLKEYVQNFLNKEPQVPFTLELDPTYVCSSKDCGGHCFSAAYRQLAPKAEINSSTLEDILKCFALGGGKVVRFDGGGDPLAHKSVRNGVLPYLAHKLGLKSTILTSGDILDRSNIEKIANSKCYVRISLNAGSDKVRHQFHGNKISIDKIFSSIKKLASYIDKNRINIPIGSTYLLSKENYSELLLCAKKAIDSGISHYSVRRVLGPKKIRNNFTESELKEIDDILHELRLLNSDSFRVFVPWRKLNEPDLDPSKGAFSVKKCWQSVFKTIIEPGVSDEEFKIQLCGRYRGNGIGQSMQLPPLYEGKDGLNWDKKWQLSFFDYLYSRNELPNKCISCIDRGFISMMDNLLGFLKDDQDFEILHLRHVV